MRLNKLFLEDKRIKSNRHPNPTVVTGVLERAKWVVRHLAKVGPRDKHGLPPDVDTTLLADFPATEEGIKKWAAFLQSKGATKISVDDVFMGCDINRYNELQLCEILQKEYFPHYDVEVEKAPEGSFHTDDEFGEHEWDVHGFEFILAKRIEIGGHASVFDTGVEIVIPHETMEWMWKKLTTAVNQVNSFLSKPGQP